MSEVEELRQVLGELERALQRFEQESSPDGVPVVRARALREIARCVSEEGAERGVEMSRLVEALDIDQSNVSRLCKRMHQSGEVERVVCCGDRRARRLVLTEEGEELASASEERAVARATRLMGQMSDLERITVMATVRLLTAAIHGSGDEE